MNELFAKRLFSIQSVDKMNFNGIADGHPASHDSKPQHFIQKW